MIKLLMMMMLSISQTNDIYGGNDDIDDFDIHHKIDYDVFNDDLDIKK
jgi:hypothetical protein